MSPLVYDLTGFVTLGSTAAVLGAGAAAYAATRRDQVGDAARQVGNAANSFASRVYEFNQQHRITERARDAAVATYHKAKDLNKKYKITEQASEMASTGYQKAKDYNEKHQVILYMIWRFGDLVPCKQLFFFFWGGGGDSICRSQPKLETQYPLDSNLSPRQCLQTPRSRHRKMSL